MWVLIVCQYLCMYVSFICYQFVEIGSLFVDFLCVVILLVLVDGCVWLVGELVCMVGIVVSIVSVYLGCFVEGGLLQVVNQGWYCYFRIVNDSVVQVFEMLLLLCLLLVCVFMLVLCVQLLVFVCICYGYLVGWLGVVFYQGLCECVWIELGE